jgi:Tol biopolymer transport system component
VNFGTGSYVRSGVQSHGNSLAVVFYSGRGGNFEVYQVDADGSNPVRLTNDPAWNGWASYVRPARRSSDTRSPL